MNEPIDIVTVNRERMDNVLEVLSMVAIGEVDRDKLHALLRPGNDAFSEVEQMIKTLAIDLTEVLEANDQYTGELEKNAQEMLEKLGTIERQQMAIQELSTPVIEVWDDVLTLPIVGVVDTRRSLDMTERLLQAIVDRQARCVIIDVTGVDIVDTMTADHFVKMIRAAGMLGTYCVVSGMNPEVAQTLARIGVELDGVRTLRSLKDALHHCFEYLRGTTASASKSWTPSKPSQSE